MRVKLRNYLHKNTLILIGFFACLFLFATLPFFHDGFFQITDDVQVVRVEKMVEELQGGQFPVRYVDSLGNGGGYMLFNFYSPFVYYLGALVHMVGTPLVATVKVVFLSGFLIGLTGIIVLLKRYADWVSVVIGAALFITAPYVGYDVYFRGALAEFFGFMVLPWLFWAFLHVREAKKNAIFFVILAGVLYALLITMHNITAYIASFFLLLLFLIPPYTKRTLFQGVIALVMGLLLAAFYWIPHVVEQGNLIYDTTFLGGQVYKTQFSTPLHLAAVEQYGVGTRYPMLGIGLMLGALLGVVGGIKSITKKQQSLKSLWLLCGIGFLCALFITSEVSLVVWDTVPFLRNVQFPWRFLTVATLFSAVLTTLFISRLQFLWQKVLLGAVLFLPVVTWYYHYFRPTEYTYVSEYRPEDTCATTTWDQELLPKWVKTCLPKEATLPLVRANNPQITISSPTVSQNGRQITFTTSGDASAVSVSKYYYPGWQVHINENPVRVFSSEKYGLVTFSVPKGEHRIEVFYDNTWWRTFGNSLTVVGMIGCCGYFLYSMRTSKKR